MKGRADTLHGLAVVAAVVLGLAVAVSLGGVEGTVAGAGVFALTAAAAGGMRWLFAVPVHIRRVLVDASDLHDRPPPDAVPQPSPLANQWSAASRRTRPELLAEDFVSYEAGSLEPVSRTRYLSDGLWPARAFRGVDAEIDEVLVQPGDTTALWVRVSCSMQPWIGKRIRATWWEAWTTTPDRDRLRSRRVIAVLDVE